jgi:hypothetical protein
LTNVQLGNGCSVSDRFLIAVGFPHTLGPDERGTRIFYLNLDLKEKWNHRDWPNQTVVSVCLRSPSSDVKRAGVALSDWGYVEIANSSEESIEQISNVKKDDVANFAHGVRQITEVDGKLFVCGYYGQIYRRDADGWKIVDKYIRDVALRNLKGQYDLHEIQKNYLENLENKELEDQTLHFNSVGGISENSIYCCGLDGAIIHFHNGQSHKIISNTKENLLDMHCVSEDDIIISGNWQTLLRGNAKDGFSLLHSSNTRINFYSVRKFQNDIYVGTTQGLLRFNGSGFDTLRQSDVGLDETTVVQQIDSVSDNYLWIVSDRHVFRFDGQNVERFDHPDNV